MPLTESPIAAQVLLVEDDAVNQIVIKGLLALIGCSVIIASNGAEALSLLTSPSSHFDVVLMDIGLPDINGMDITRQVRQSTSPLQGIPIIALTGHINPRDKDACLSCGMNSFISKPTTLKTLYQELKSALEIT